MKKITPILLVLIHFSVLTVLAAPKPQDERRIEEQKRKKLKSTEAHLPSQQAPKPMSSPLKPEDFMYIAELPFRKVTYGYDLAKLMVILKQVENDYVDLNAQAQYLKENNLLPERLHNTFDPMKPLRRGVTAYSLRKVLNIKGGVFLRIFKNSERYAMKELSYEGIMAEGNTNEIITGDELATAFTNAINYLQAQ